MIRIFLILIIGFFVTVASAIAHGDKKNFKIKIESPPEALSRYYPPDSVKMELLDIMHRMAGSFNGAWIDAKEGEWENALKNASALEEAYKKAHDMVGKEWGKRYFKLDAATGFKAAVAAKDMKLMDRTADQLGDTCEKCHTEQYVNVWLKFHWSDFGKIEMEDPVTEKKMEFEEYKHKLLGSFYALMNDGKQADSARAKKAGKEFIARYRGLKASCMKCHEDDQVKYFFVGGKVEKALSDLATLLGTVPLDMGEVFKKIGVIGPNGCKKCHLTHRWAAILKDAQH